MTGSSRIPPPPSEATSGELVLAPPPTPADAGGSLLGLVQVLGSLGSTALVATMLGSAAGGRWHRVLVGLLGVVAVLGLVAVLTERRRHRARTVTGPRTAYLRYLGTVVDTLREAADLQRSVLEQRHPDPRALPSIADEGSGVWASAELLVRYGVSDRPSCLKLVAPPDDPLRPADAHLTHVVERLLAVHEVQPALPAVVDLRACERIEVRGPLRAARSLARAVVCSAVAAHPPEHLTVGVLTSADRLPDWDWVKWLPHAGSPSVVDAVGPRRLVATEAATLTALLPTDRHLLLVVDGDLAPPPGPAGRTVLALPTRLSDRPAGLTLTVGGDLVGGRAPARVEEPGREAVRCAADQCDEATAEALARRLASLPTRSTQGGRDLLHLLGLDDVRRVDPAACRLRRSESDLLRVPLGTDDHGGPVLLDLKESAQHGVGPHGLVVGATGSGKSELLRTLVVGLALTHSPELLTLVLVDFKGGATFAGLADLPHVSAVITNLADDLALVARMQDALAGELVRRQEVLRAAGHLASARDLGRARTAGAALPALPSLLVVVDEFSELLAAEPELVDLFVTIGRLGRSLGVHLLLASQRLEEGRLRGLDSHLSYRIGLRTFSPQESRAVLGVPDAFDLPPLPGHGYLRAGPGAPLRFRAAYVSGSVVPVPDAPERILPWTVGEVPLGGPVRPSEPPTVLELAVAGLRGQGPVARRMWLPPLDEPATLDRLLPDLARDPVLGLVSRHWRATGRLTLPVGLVDRPRDHRREVLTVDLAGDGGHVAVVGGPRSGRSTLLQTLVAGLALTTTPLESQVYVIDLGGAFASYAGLPHVAGLAGPSEPDVVRRVVAEVSGILDRRAGGSGGAGHDGWGEVFVVVDGWHLLRPDLDDVEEGLQRLAARGLAHGCHLLTATSRWADFRAATRDLLGTRIELRLGEPADSEVDRRAAGLVPRGRPGRGLVDGPWHVLTALPRFDGQPDAGSLAAGVAHLVTRVTEAWPGPAGPKLRLLPPRVTLDDLLARAETSARGLLIGLREDDLAPVGLDLDADPHWLVLGDPGVGA